jgi:nucleoside-diphosphate-sugar epimerase
MSDTADLHVVIGAGPLGRAVAREVHSRGRRVRIVNRAGNAKVAPGIEAMAADVERPEDARRAGEGAVAVYHCANAPYDQWERRLPPLMNGVIATAAVNHARVVYGDNLYTYGVAGVPLREDMPPAAKGVNGRVRIRMEQMLMAAHRAGQITATIGRASDFYGPEVLNSTFGERVFPRLLAGRPAQVLGNPDVPHTVSYIVDVGHGLATLGERDEALGEIWHLPNAEPRTMRELVAIAAEEIGVPPRLSAVPRLAIVLLGLVNPTMRRVHEVLYQSEKPWLVDDSKFRRVFGARVTPLRDGIHETVVWYRGQRQPAAAPRPA